MFNGIIGLVKNVTGIVKQKGDGTNQAILENVRDERQLKKAVNWAEKIFFLTDPIAQHLDKKELRLYKIYRRKFNDND